MTYIRTLYGQIVEKEEAIKDFIHRFDWYEPNYEWEMPQVLSYKCVEDCIDHCDFELVVSSIKDEDGEYTKYGEIVEETRIERFDFVKQADTIRELCDEIVVRDYSSPNCKPFCYCKNWDNVLNERIAKSLKDIKINIYGAIWVAFDSNDKPTLKPVAKLNEEGELELL